jgi:DNA primase
MARDTVQEVKSRLTILDVVGSVVKLKRAGRSYTGLCPFHKEKTPSFHVSVERGSYHCFGCGVGGDMFTFIEKTEGVDFKGALKILADRAGVPLEYSSGAREDKSKQERMRDAMNAATQFYTGQLGDSGAAYDYARSRGLNGETVKDWGLGYAPDSWRALLEHMTALGFSIEELRSAGLIKEADGKQGTYYDRFRARLIFPIRDANGRVVAFTGRALAADEPAKYLNSPETDLYHKSDILYGMDKAKDAIRTRGFALLVEGQMDLLHAHQAGFANTVALSGTAFTEQHAALIKRYAENLMLVLDGDSAGMTATAKAAQLALRAGLKIKAARMPLGKDPADVASEDPQEFAKRIKEGKPIVEFFLTALGEREHDSHKLILAAERVVLPLIRAIKSPMEREHFVTIAARALSLSPEAIRESVARLPKEQVEGPEAPRKAGDSETLRGTPKKSQREARTESLAPHAIAYSTLPLAERVKKEYKRVVGVPLPSSSPEADIFAIEAAYGESPLEAAADDLIRAFEEAYIREAYQEEVANLRRAEAAGDAAAITRSSEAVAKLSARLAALMR